MDRHEAVVFLFSMAKEIKRSYQSPVMLLTMKDYADGIFKSRVEMRKALLQEAPPDRIVDIISRAHYEWLNTVNEVEAFKNRINSVPREQIFRVLEFTKERAKERMCCFQKFANELQSTMNKEERNIINTDINMITDLHLLLNSMLDEKLNCIRLSGDKSEFKVFVSEETEELMNWLDTMNDYLVLHFSKVVGKKYPHLLTELTNTLDNIVDEVAASTEPDALDLIKKMQNRKQRLSWAIRLNPRDELDMRNILEKIKSLEARIERLKLENSSELLALQHKTMYLEDRLNSLENLKMSLYTLKNKRMEDIQTKWSLKCQEVHIFDHLLPSNQRNRLVKELVALWHDTVYGDKEKKSIISILSIADIKEVYSDEFGQFTVDKHGRKLYRGSSDQLYQVNHRYELVPVSDDEKHVYFYDNCGRYYISEKKQKIYIAHNSASEYLINRHGKVKEVIDGVKYWYDSLGRYRFDESGKKIYSDPRSDEEYENDGLGNLVRIRSMPHLEYTECPAEPLLIEEMKYLQRVVGTVLKACIADVILHQPLDPILYLADCLENYHENIQNKEKKLKDEYNMLLEREKRARNVKLTSSDISSSAEYIADSNFLNYESNFIL